MWRERKCLSFEMVAGGFEPPPFQLTIQRSTMRQPLPTCDNDRMGICCGDSLKLMVSVSVSSLNYNLVGQTEDSEVAVHTVLSDVIIS